MLDQVDICPYPQRRPPQASDPCVYVPNTSLHSRQGLHPFLLFPPTQSEDDVLIIQRGV